MRLPVSTRIHRATHALSASQRTPDRVHFHVRLVREHHKHSSHWYTMEVRTAGVVHRKISLAFRLFLTVGDEQREECFHTFQRWHSAEESAAEGTSDFFMAFLISRTTNRDL